MSLANGRHYLAIPGPSVMPDRVLAAMHRAAVGVKRDAVAELAEGIAQLDSEIGEAIPVEPRGDRLRPYRRRQRDNVQSDRRIRRRRLELGDEILDRLGLDPGTTQLVRGFARPNLALRAREVRRGRERQVAIDALLAETLGSGDRPNAACGARASV